jgi:hypothetical protein
MSTTNACLTLTLWPKNCEMMNSFKVLRELGLINYKFNDIVDFLE